MLEQRQLPHHCGSIYLLRLRHIPDPMEVHVIEKVHVEVVTRILRVGVLIAGLIVLNDVRFEAKVLGLGSHVFFVFRSIYF